MQELEQKLNYSFRDRELLRTALTHSSYANEHNCASNERLEFVGDSVLGMVTASHLYLQFPQLPAPMVLDGTPLGNANTAAEYLDNVLDATTTPEFEKFCIGSAIVLGEVASCHKILAQVLTEEPTSEAPLELKEKIKRLYADYYAEVGFVPQNADTDLALLGSEGVPLHNIADGSLHQNIEAQSRLSEDAASSEEAPAEEAEDEDEYEYVPSRAPWVLCTVVLAILCLVLLLRGNGKKEAAPAPAGETPVAVNDEQAGTTEGTAEAGKAEEATASASEDAGTAEGSAEASKAETPANPDEAGAKTPDAAGEAEKPAEGTEAAPAEAKPAETAPVESAPAVEGTDKPEAPAEPKEAPAVTETKEPAEDASATETDKPAETEAKEEAKAEPEEETDTPATEEDAKKSEETSPWASDSTVGKQVAAGQLLIRQNKTSKPNAKDAWVPVGESYVSLPGFQPKIDFAKQVQATLKDSAKLTVKEGVDGRIELLMDYGQFVFQTAERGAKSVQLAIAGFEGVKLFLAPETLVAFDVRLDDHSSDDPATSPVVLVDVYLFDGGVEISGKNTLKNYEAGGGVAFQLDPNAVNGTLPSAKPMTLVPTWIVKNSSSRRKDSVKMREALVKNYEAGKSLLTCLYEFESDKNKNIQALAKQSLLQLGDKSAIDDLVNVVAKNSRKRQDRQRELLRSVIFQSQQHAQTIKKQMIESKNEDLYKALLKK